MPEDMLEAFPSIFFRTGATKTAWKGPVIQTLELDEPEIIDFVSPARNCLLSEDDEVFPFSSAQVRDRWGRILDAIGVDKHLIPIRSLGGGGTVWLFRKIRDIPPVY